MELSSPWRWPIEYPSTYKNVCYDASGDVVIFHTIEMLLLLHLCLCCSFYVPLELWPSYVIDLMGGISIFILQRF